ncbi:MAG: TasA family protein [Candidatus Roizmanbacteria bacterium]
MKKIIAGILGLFIVVALVSGSAFALFLSSATLTGVTFAAGNADLQISVDGLGFANTKIAPAEMNFQNMYPGYSATDTFWLKNNSSVPNMKLSLTGKLTSATTGLPSVLADNIQLEVVEIDSFGADIPASTTGFKTLTVWNTTAQALPGVDLNYGATRQYRVNVKIDSTVGNDIAGLTITGALFTFTGTQVYP